MASLPILDGRRFGCTRCGNCCREPGFVFMTFVEMQAMAEHLDLRLAAFKKKYGIEWDASLRRWAISATDGQGCPLLTPDLGCSVHPVKPSQCRTFPFWPELLDDALGWEDAKRYCPGMDAQSGRLYSAEEIEAIRAERRGT